MEDPFYEEEPGFSLGRFILNVVTFLVLVGTVALFAVYSVLFVDPQNEFNPFPPPTLPPTLGPPTPTATAAIPLPTEVPVTSTPRPLPTSPGTEVPPTATIAPTETIAPTVEGGSQFGLQESSPGYSSDERGCDYLGVGGFVFDLNDLTISGLTIRIGGEISGQSIGPVDVLTGNAADRLGQGAYYYEIASQPMASQGTVWVRVIDSSSQLPISDQVFFDTTDSCDQNLILISWEEVGS